jgi:hypothetical protein
MESNTIQSKISGVRALLKVRGYKVLNNSQVAILNDLCKISELSIVDIVNEIDSAPDEHLKQTVVKARSFISSGLNSLADSVDPTFKKAKA